MTNEHIGDKRKKLFYNSNPDLKKEEEKETCSSGEY